MNAIQKALAELKFRIPPEILNIGFGENAGVVNTYNLSLDEIILTKVIRPRVLVDCNIVGGIELTVNLSRCKIEPMPSGEYIITVPKQLTGGKSIISVLSIISNSNVSISAPHNLNNQYSDVLTAGMNMMNSNRSETVIQSARTELIADNKILVEEPNIPIIDGTMRINVENDSNLSNINPRSYIYFSNLVEYAVKAYLNIMLKVRLDKGYIFGGHDLGIIKDIIDSYDDMNTIYQEFLMNTWRKVAFMNDNTKHDRFLKSMLSSTC